MSLMLKSWPSDQTLFPSLEFFPEILEREITSGEKAIFFGDLFCSKTSLGNAPYLRVVEWIKSKRDSHLHMRRAIKLQTHDHIF